MLNVVFAAHSGLWGVLVIDMIQFFIKMTAVIAAAYFALKAPQVGGLAGLIDKLSVRRGPGGIDYLAVLPDFTNNWDLAVAVFIMPIAVQWWAVWYPGAEPGGGSYIAQRMLASKSEKDALGAVLFFNVAHYVLRPWPWILVALCSIIVYPELSDIQRAFPNLDPRLLGHDIAYPAMLKFLPVGFVGLMVGGLIAANSSTILTHLNWGASYLVHDFYRRFIRRDADRAALRRWSGRLAPSACSSARRRWSICSTRRRTRSTSSCRSAPAPGCSTWCAGSGGASTRGARSSRWSARSSCRSCCSCWRSNGVPISTHVGAAHHGRGHDRLLGGHGVRRPADRSRRADRVLSQGPAGRAGLGADSRGGRHCRATRAAGRQHPARAARLVRRLHAPIWSALFTVGNFLYMRYATASILLVVFIISGLVLASVTRTLWGEARGSRLSGLGARARGSARLSALARSRSK